MMERRRQEYHPSTDHISGPDAVIIEFKVQSSEEKERFDIVREALLQIEEKNCQANLVAGGIPAEHIRKYGFAFRCKTVLIGDGKEGNQA